MKKYWQISWSYFLGQLSFRWHFLLGFLTNGLGLLIAYYMWSGIYENQGNQVIEKYAQGQMLQYIFLTNLVGVLYSFETVSLLSNFIRTGKLSIHLMRPVNLLLELFSIFIGGKLLVILLLLPVLAGVFSLSYSLLYSLLIVLYAVCNIFMFFMVVAVIGLLGFWVIQMWPLRGILNASYLILGGLYFPIDLFPGNLGRAVQYNPFSLVSYAFVRSVQTQLPYKELVLYLIAVFCWILGSLFLWSVGLRSGLAKYEGMGA